MEGCIKGLPVVGYDFILKALFTIITLKISRSGSVITPILFIGATAGSFFSDLVGADQSTFAAIGFVSLLAGTTNTPIASSILAIELFGATVAPYAAVSCVISFLMSGHQSLYASQQLVIPKSEALAAEPGKPIGSLTANSQPTEIRLPAWLRRIRLFLKRQT